MNPWAGIAVVLTALTLLMGTLRILQGRVSPEVSRKAVHVGMGLVCLGFPWMFPAAWPVIVLAVLAVGGLTAVRTVPALRAAAGGVLGGVDRVSHGEIYFPIAVATVFVLAAGDPLLFVVPVLTLTVADTVGALIGGRYGSARYRTDDGEKSAEGSIAFFTAAFLTCHVPLLLSSATGRAESLLIGLTAGFVVMLLEAIAWRGQDNLIIPIGMYFLLRFYLPLSPGELLVRLMVVAGLVGLVVVWRRRTTLSDSAILAGALSGYALWAFGGWFWLLPPLLLFLVYVALPAFPADDRPVQNLHAVTRVMAGGFFWMLTDYLSGWNCFSPYLLVMAAHTGNIVTARLRVVRGGLPAGRILLIGWAAPSLLFSLLAMGAAAAGQAPAAVIPLVPLSVALSILVFYPLWPVSHLPSNKIRIWISETLVAIGASVVGLFRF